MCGEVKSKEKEKTTSTPLVTVSDLQRLPQWETIILRIRTMPFKTKLTPHFQMNWGHNFPKAKYPQREKNPVEIFDLKGFVNKKREEKMNNMLNGDDPQGGASFSPFGGGPSPFGGMGGSPFGESSMPFSGGPSPFAPSNDSGTPGGINVDDIVKRIDAKIAEIEEEERREQAEKLNNNQSPSPAGFSSEPPKETPIIFEDTQVSTVPSENKNSITDDQFFDDFFSDE